MINTVSCWGQASNTSDYTSWAYAQAARANLEQGCDVEAAACVPKAPDSLQSQNAGTRPVTSIRSDTFLSPVNSDI